MSIESERLVIVPIHSSSVTTKSDKVGVGEGEKAKLMDTDNNHIDVVEMEYARPTSDVGSNQIFTETTLNSTNEMSTSIRTEEVTEVEIAGDKNDGCCSGSKHGDIDVVPYQILTCPERCVSNAARHVKRFSHLWFSHLLLLSILLGYTALGAVIFNRVESPHENQEKHDAIETRNEMLSNLWNISQNVTDLQEWLNESVPIMIEFEAHLEKWYTMGFSTNPKKILWSFWGAMFYCGTVYSTIGWHEVKAKCDIQKSRYALIEELWDQSVDMDYEEWKSYATDKLRLFENDVHKAHDEDGITTYSGTKVWSFDGALVYSITIFTTIGYGHIVPSTVIGRALTMVYATFGIPLLLMVLTDFGKLFTRGIKFIWSLAHRFYHTKSCKVLRRTVPIQAVVRVISQKNKSEQPYEASTNNHNYEVSNAKEDILMRQENPIYEIDDEFDLPVGVAVSLLIGYIMLGAYMFIQWECNWSYFEAVYFVFISMSTIGFGDYVPNHPIFMMGTFVYLLFGLSLTSMCINVIQEWLTRTFKKASTSLSVRMGIGCSEMPHVVTVTSQLQEANASMTEFHSTFIKPKGE